MYSDKDQAIQVKTLTLFLQISSTLIEIKD